MSTSISNPPLRSSGCVRYGPGPVSGTEDPESRSPDLLAIGKASPMAANTPSTIPWPPSCSGRFGLPADRSSPPCSPVLLPQHPIPSCSRVPVGYGAGQQPLPKRLRITSDAGVPTACFERPGNERTKIRCFSSRHGRVPSRASPAPWSSLELALAADTDSGREIVIVLAMFVT